ncbi:MAG: hypothetical protein GX638_15495, partial [Crenarchaeota archaeon]|nr:hypothetical protein [Thermoproteota archaeon]
MKHALVAFSIFVLSTLLFVGLQAVEGVDANFLPRGVPDAPPIIISSPLNTTYTQNDVLLNFTIVGISNWWVPSYHLTSLYYEIDGNSTNIAFPTGGINVEQYSVLIASLAKGQYTLTIHAHATGLHRNNYPKSGTTQYFIESNQTVSFT